MKKGTPILSIYAWCSFLLIGIAAPLAAKTAQSKSLRYGDHIYKDNIKTVQFSIAGLPLSNPVITLNGKSTLQLEFDELSQDISDLSYTVILCNADWTPSELTNFDYIQGFTESPIFDYAYSSSTVVPYTHYRLNLPNEDFKLTKSGNYLLVLFEDGDMENVVLTRRFMIVEPQVEISSRIKRPTRLQYFDTHQEVQFDVLHPDLDIRNPFQELKVTVMQNFNWATAYKQLKPVFVKDEKLAYTLDGSLIFQGAREYRYFDTRNLQLLHSSLQKVSWNRDAAWLMPEEARSFRSYTLFKDINGKLLPGRFEAVNDEALDADYIDVHFELSLDAPMPGSDIYIYGALCYWEYRDECKMEYDHEKKVYHNTLKLKQGRYDYMYALQMEGDSIPSTEPLEGNYYETENDYQIIVYYRPTGARYDRIIAYQEMNTLNNNNSRND